MPGMDGLSVIREARRSVRELPVIIITGFSTEANAIEALNLGVTGYLTKPFRLRSHDRRWRTEAVGLPTERRGRVTADLVIQLAGLTKSFGDRILLDNVTWQVTDGDRVGLCGPNGAGKTTLLRILAGLDEADRGHVVKPADLTVGYLPQDGLEHSGRTLVGRSVARRFSRCSTRARKSIASSTRWPIPSLPDGEHETLLVRYHDLTEFFRQEEGHSIELRVTQVLEGLGFSQRGFRQAGRDVLRRLADAHRARQAAARPADAAAARRADEPPRSRRAQLARGVPRRPIRTR